MSELKEKNKVKEKTSVFSSKIFIGVSIISLIGFVIIVAFGISIFRSISVTPEEDSNFQVVKREGLSEDPLITLVSLTPSLKDSDPVRGLEKASVTIVEFGDFECSYCASMKSTLGDILAAYPQQVRLVWKDFPLTAVHDQAYQAAVAARCAQLQGKFWEMHDLLLANNFFLSPDNFSEFAEELGLNLEDFNQCLDLEQAASLVDEGIKQAQDLKIEGTPHFFINDQEISGTATFEDFKQLIEIELER